MLRGNVLSLTGLALLVFPFTAWYLIYKKQYEICNGKTFRVNVMIARTALFLPFYSFFMWIALMEPVTYDALQIPFAIVEGYAFYSFLSLLVANLGGPEGAIELMRTAPEGAFCCCYYRDPVKFYNQVLNAQWYVFFVRVPLIVIGTIAAYAHLDALYGICTLLALAILIYALISLINYYEHLMFLDMAHLLKLVTLKVSIGLIVVQGIVEQILIMTGSLDGIVANPHYTQDGTITRYYCFIVLLEYIFFSTFVGWVYRAEIKFTGFRDPEPRPSEHVLSSDGVMGGRTLTECTTVNGEITRKDFSEQVFMFTDVWYKYSLKLNADGEEALLNSTSNPAMNFKQSVIGADL